MIPALFVVIFNPRSSWRRPLTPCSSKRPGAGLERDCAARVCGGASEEPALGGVVGATARAAVEVVAPGDKEPAALVACAVDEDAPVLGRDRKRSPELLQARLVELPVLPEEDEPAADRALVVRPTQAKDGLVAVAVARVAPAGKDDVRVDVVPEAVEAVDAVPGVRRARVNLAKGDCVACPATLAVLRVPRKALPARPAAGAVEARTPLAAHSADEATRLAVARPEGHLAVCAAEPDGAGGAAEETEDLCRAGPRELVVVVGGIVAEAA